MAPKAEIVQAWLQRAEEDLRAARVLAGGDTALAGAIGFHCQQVVEKVCKAFLQWKEVRAPRTHDLRRLIDLCAGTDAGFEKLRESEKLTELAVVARYPGMPSPQGAQIGEWLAIAERAYTFVLERVPKETHP